MKNAIKSLFVIILLFAVLFSVSCQSKTEPPKETDVSTNADTVISDTETTAVSTEIVTSPPVIDLYRSCELHIPCYHDPDTWLLRMLTCIDNGNLMDSVAKEFHGSYANEEFFCKSYNMQYVVQKYVDSFDLSVDDAPLFYHLFGGNLDISMIEAVFSDDDTPFLWENFNAHILYRGESYYSIDVLQHSLLISAGSAMANTLFYHQLTEEQREYYTELITEYLVRMDAPEYLINYEHACIVHFLPFIIKASDLSRETVEEVMRTIIANVVNMTGSTYYQILFTVDYDKLFANIDNYVSILGSEEYKYPVDIMKDFCEIGIIHIEETATE